MANSLAVYTTVHRSSLPFVRAWYASIAEQTDRDFTLVIAVDALTRGEVLDAIGADVTAEWMFAGKNDSPAQIRHRAIRRMVDSYDAVIFVDSDDTMSPTRVSAARRDLERYDVSACALRVIDGAGRDLGITFAPPDDWCAVGMLPRYNVFGLSNSAYRSAVLGECLPIPDDSILIDWLLATRAWLNGASLYFDREPRMQYRQYGSNTASIVPPFSEAGVRRATRLVLDHYECLLEGVPRDSEHPGLNEIEQAQALVRKFHDVLCAERLRRYTDSLNQLPPVHVWWWSVAHPVFEALCDN